MENVVGPAGTQHGVHNLAFALTVCELARFGHSAEVFGSDKMFIYGGVGDASVYRDDLWFLYMGTLASVI